MQYVESSTHIYIDIYIYLQKNTVLLLCTFVQSTLGVA